jgi:hypothetical protein
MVEGVERVGQQPQDLLRGLYEALWYGDVEARRIAMAACARHGHPSLLLPILDAVHDHPELLRPAIDSLGQLRDARARFFLNDVLLAGGADGERAAGALALIGGPALDLLREATRSTDASLRTTAVLALLPYAGLDDLTVLHEYVGRNAQDPSEVLRRVRERVTALETILDEQQSAGGLGVEPQL